MSFDSDATDNAPVEIAGRADTAARLRTVIGAWKAEVRGGHDALTGQVKQANQQLGRLLEILSTRNDHAMALASAKDEIARLRTALSESDAAPGTITRYSDGLSPAIESLRREMAGTFDRLTSTIATWTSEVSHAEEGLSRQISESNAQLDSLLHVLDRSEPEKTRTDSAPLTELVRNQEHTIAELREALAALKEETEKLRAQDPRTSDEYLELADELEAVKGDAASMREQLATLNRQFEDQKTAASTLEANHRVSLDNALNTLDEVTTALEEQAKFEHSWAAELQEIANWRESTETALTEAQSRVKTLETELAQATARTEALDEVESELVQAKERLEELSQVEAERDSLQERFQSLETQSASSEQAALQEREQLLQQLNVLRADLEDQQNHLKEKDTENEVLQQRVTSLETEKSNAESQAIQSENTCTELNSEIEKLRSQVVELENAQSEAELRTRENAEATVQREAELRILWQKIDALESEKLSFERSAKRAYAKEKSRQEEAKAQLWKRTKRAIAERDKEIAERDKEIAELQQQVNELELANTEIPELVTQRDQARDEKALLSQRMDELEALIQQGGQVMETHVADVTSLMDQITTLETTLAEAWAVAPEASESSEVIEALENRIAELESALHDKETAVEDSSTPYVERDDEISGLKERIGSLEAELESTREEVSKRDWYLGERDEGLRQASIQIESLQAEIAAVKEELTQRDENLRGESEHIETLQAEVATLKYELTQRDSSLREASERIESLLLEVTAVKEELVQRDWAIGEREAELIRLRTQTEKMSSQLSGLVEVAENIAPLESEKTALEARTNELSSLLELREAELEEGSHEIEVLNERVDGLLKELEDAKSVAAERDALHEAQGALEAQIANLNEAIAATEMRVEVAQAARVSLESECQELRRKADELTKLQAEHNTTLNDKQAIERELEAVKSVQNDSEKQIVELNESLRELRAELANMEEQYEESERALASLHEELADARDAAEHSDSMIADLAESMESYRTQLNERERELEETRIARDTFEKERDEARNSANNLARKSEDLDATVARLEEDKQARDESFQDAKAAAAAQENALRERDARLAVLEQASSEALAREEELRQTVDEARAAIEALRAQETQRESELRERLERIAELESQLDETKVQLRDAEQQAHTLKTSDSSEVAEREAKLAALQQEVETLRDAAAGAEAESSANREEMKRAMQEMSKAIYDRDQAIESLRALKSERGRLQAGMVGIGTESSAQEKAARERREIVLISEMLQDESRHALGEILVNAGVITEQQLKEALKVKKKSKEMLLGTILLELEYATEDAIAQAVACQMSLPLVTPSMTTIERDATELLSKEQCTWHVCIPMRASKEHIVLAMANPLDESAKRKVEDVTRRPVKAVVATPSSILAAIDDVYGIF